MNTPKTHPVNVSYLVVGLVFLGIAGSWALRSSGVIDTGDVRWLGPLVLVAAGVVGLVAFSAKSISRGRRAPAADEPPAYDPFTVGSDEYDSSTDSPIDTGSHDTGSDDTDTRSHDRGDLR
jgi:hypothetical protein